MSSSTERRARLARALWLLVPLLGFAGAESIARRALPPHTEWYRGLEGKSAEVLFLGSSRVAAAVDSATFRRTIAELTGKPARVRNLGQGYSTPIEHTLGVRNWLASRTSTGAPFHCFVELTGGVPAPATWRGAGWVHPDQPQILLDVVRTRDLPALWRSGEPAETKAQITLRHLLDPIQLLTRREALRQRFLDLLETDVVKRLEPLEPASVAKAGADLRATGGIDQRDESVARARALAQHAAEQVREADYLVDWDRQVLADLVSMVQAAGGDVVFFETPLANVFRRAYDLPAARAGFQRWARARGLTVLDPVASFPDEEFPDLWHLAASRAPAYTEALARTWIGSTNQAPSKSDS